MVRGSDSARKSMGIMATTKSQQGRSLVSPWLVWLSVWLSGLESKRAVQLPSALPSHCSE